MNNSISRGALLLMGALLAACGGGSPASEPDVAEGQAVLTAGHQPITLTPAQMEMAGVELGMPERRMIASYVECAGQVEVPPQSLASVYSPVNGFVKTVRFLPGDYVKKGTLLTQLTHPDLVRLQREYLEARSRLTALESDYRRKETLAGAEAASQRALEQARADFEVERARVNGLRAELTLIGLPADQLEKDGQVLLSLDLRAPVSGYINQVNINIGKLVSPSDLLYEIVDNSHVHLELRIFSKDIDQIREGQRIEAWVPGKEAIYAADVHLIGRMIDPQTKTALVHGHFSREPVPLIPGTFMHAHIYSNETEALVAPSTALVREGEQTFIFVLGPQGFEKRPVTPGRADGDYVEIDGLKLAGGEQIAVKGAYYINGSIAGEE